MSKIRVLEDRKTIEVPIPLTTTSGKIRVKTRSHINEYGLPHASKQNIFTQANYVEWQIGYDVVIDDEEKLALTTLPNHQFNAYNTKTKALYELSEYLFYFAKWGLVSSQDLQKLSSNLKQLPDSELIENNANCQIKRTHPKEITINNVVFNESKIEYPLLNS